MGKDVLLKSLIIASLLALPVCAQTQSVQSSDNIYRVSFDASHPDYPIILSHDWNTLPADFQATVDKALIAAWAIKPNPFTYRLERDAANKDTGRAMCGGFSPVNKQTSGARVGCGGAK